MSIIIKEIKNAFKGLARARVKIVLILNLPRIVGSSSSCYDTKCCLAEQVIARFVDCEAKNARRVLQINFSSFPEVKCSMLAESHFGQNDTLAKDTLAGTLWPE